MSDIRFLTYPVFQAFDDNGNPLSGGKVNVYSEGTTDRIDTWTDATQNTKNANPVILNSRGEAEIWFDAPAKIVLTDSSDVTIKTIDSVSPLNAQTITGKYNLVDNGSFELDGDGDGQPDSWDIVETDGSSTVEIDTSTVAHGSNSLKFVSGSGGGGTATSSEKFPVKDGKEIGVSFFVASTTTTATNKVDLIFYDSSGTNPSTSNVYTSSGTSPSTLTEKSFSASVPSGKTQAEIKLTGVDNTETATTYFDFVQVRDDQLGGYQFTGAAGEVTASAAELNTLDGVTATTEELNEYPTTGRWVLLDTQTASSSSSLDFTTGIDGTHERYMFVLHRLSPSGSGNLQLRVTRDGGSNWDSGASDYGYRYDDTNLGLEDGSAGASSIELYITSSFINYGEVILEEIGSSSSPATDPIFRYHVGGGASLTNGWGWRNTNAAIDGARFLHSGGNISSGNIRLYGWKNGS